MQTKITNRNIARMISEKAILPAMAMLLASFIRAYLAVSRLHCKLPRLPIFNDTYASKRVNNRSVHHRKFALFPSGAEHGRSI